MPPSWRRSAGTSKYEPINSSIVEGIYEKWAGVFTPVQTMRLIALGVLGVKGKSRLERLTAQPFSLGIEGEKWYPELPGLLVPVEDGSGSCIAVIHDKKDGYAVVTGKSWIAEKDLVMVVAIVHEERKAIADGKKAAKEMGA